MEALVPAAFKAVLLASLNNNLPPAFVSNPIPAEPKALGACSNKKEPSNEGSVMVSKPATLNLFSSPSAASTAAARSFSLRRNVGVLSSLPNSSSLPPASRAPVDAKGKNAPIPLRIKPGSASGAVPVTKSASLPGNCASPPSPERRLGTALDKTSPAAFGALPCSSSPPTPNLSLMADCVEKFALE